MKTILLAGSSIFEAWRNAADISPGATVVNSAIGGTITSYWIAHLADVLVTESPDVVLFYCGSNDINAGVAEEEIVANTSACRAIVHAFSPEMTFAYFSIIKAPQKLGKWDLIDRLNAAIRGELSAGDLYVESNTVFFPDGSPVERFYVEDGLHLTDEAYETLVMFSQPIVADWLATGNATKRPSPLVVGGHSFIPELGNDPPLDFDDQLAMVSECLEQGINCFDTTYEPERFALGRVLEILGRRDEVQIIAWNFFADESTGDYLCGPQPYVASHIETLLAQLRTEYIDRLVIHPLQDDFQNQAQLEVARAWAAAGMVGSLGTWAPGNDPAARYGQPNSYDFMVAPRNLDNPNTESFAASKGLGWHTFATSPFNRGWLLDRLVASAVEERSESPQALRARIADAMLRFSLHDPNVDHLIVGIRQVAWIGRNLESVARGPLTQTEQAWLFSQLGENSGLGS